MTDTEPRLNAPVAQPVRGRPFTRGNPGRRPGARNRATVLAEKLLSKDVKIVVESVLKSAAGGDMLAAKLVLERILPPLKTRRLCFPMPEIRTVEDVHAAMNGLWAAVSSGVVTPDEAATLGKLLEQHAAVLEVNQLERRLRALEDDAARRV
jgi:hypothetical protein